MNGSTKPQELGEGLHGSLQTLCFLLYSQENTAGKRWFSQLQLFSGLDHLQNRADNMLRALANLVDSGIKHITGSCDHPVLPEIGRAHV